MQRLFWRIIARSLKDWPNMIGPNFVNYIDIELMKEMCHPLAVALFDTKDDPIAQFSEHELSLLDSTLNNPKQTFGGRELYPALTEKAAILYYGLIKNHPFKNGNKRIATASLLMFLYINDFWLKGKKEDIENYLVDMAIKTSNSKPQGKDLILSELENWLKSHIVKLA